MLHMTRACFAALLLVSRAVTSSFALDVTSFGARPDDGLDDTSAFLAAFKEVRSQGVKHIVIPRGRYELRADGNPESPKVLFPVEGLNGLIIEGRDAELMMSGAGGVFSFTRCRKVTVSGLTLDWKRPAFSEGTVIATGPRHFDVRVDDAYPVKGGEPVPAFMSYHAETRLPDGRGLDIYDSVERTELVAPQTLRVHLNRQLTVPTGKLLVLRHSVYGGSVFQFHRCADVAVSNVTVYAGPGMGLNSSVTTNIALQRFHVRIRPGSHRLMSSTADATHFGGCKGTVLIEDCLFEGMGDDGVNIKSGLYLTVRQLVDPFTVLGQHNLKMSDVPDAGDTLEMAHPDILSPFASGIVREARLEPGEERMHRIRFEAPVPPELKAGDVIGNASRVAKLRMARCTVRANRARGVLCQTRDVIIEQCRFEHCTGPGVVIFTETVHFHESIGTRDVIIRHNRFENCNRGAISMEAALCAMAYWKHYAYPAQPGVHRNVTLDGNHIVRTDESGIFAVGVDGLTLRNNKIEHAGLRGHRPHGKEPIWIQDCARVVR